MSVVQAFCPSCGAPVEFRRGLSVVVVCEYCRSVVARGDRAIEDLGKVAELVETGSPLQVGLRGAYRGLAFELTGRAQLGHQMGGVWDEWYADFSEGRWGWLAEAQGRFYLTFQKPLAPQTMIPPFESLQPGLQLTLIPGTVPLTIGETGMATALGAQGEHLGQPGQEAVQVKRPGLQGDTARFDFGHLQHVVDEAEEVFAATVDDVQLVALVGLEAVVAAQNLDKAEDGVEGGA